MKKITLTTFISFLIFLSCGVEENPPVEPIPDIDVVLELAWKNYNAGKFTTAFSLFDSAVVLNSYEPRAYYGKGWAALQILKSSEATSSFRFSLILQEGIADIPVFNEKISAFFDSTSYGIDTVIGSDTIWFIKPDFAPVLGVSTVKLRKKAGKLNTLTLRHFTDSLIFFKGSYPDPVPDTIIDTTKTPYDTTIVVDSIFSNYYRFSSIENSSDTAVIFAYAGNAGSAVSQEKYMDALISIKALTMLDTTKFPFSHYPSFTLRDMKSLMAYSAFKLGLFQLCVDILLELDPGWNAPLDPFDPDAYEIILKKLMELIGG